MDEMRLARFAMQQCWGLQRMCTLSAGGDGAYRKLTGEKVGMQVHTVLTLFLRGKGV